MTFYFTTKEDILVTTDLYFMDKTNKFLDISQNILFYVQPKKINHTDFKNEGVKMTQFSFLVEVSL